MHLIAFSLLVFSILNATHATLIVHLKNGALQTDLYFNSSYAPTSPTPFDLNGPIYIMQTTDVEELQPLDLEGFIVLGSRVNRSHDDFNFSQLVFAKKGLGYITQVPGRIIMAFPNIYSLPVTALTYDDAIAVADLWETSNRTLTVTIISDDNEQITVGRSGGSVFLIVINLVILLATLAYVCYQLHSFKEGASVTKIALLGVLLANLGLIAERILMILFIFTPYITTLVHIPFSVIGPMFIAFSAIFISLYWSTLAFPTQVKMKSKQASLPILAFGVLSLAAFTITVAADLVEAALIIQICFVAIIMVIATYFIVIGGILIRTLNRGNKIVATKRKITKRLTYMLILTGISLYGIVGVAIFMSIVFGPPISVFYTTRAILSLFCSCSIVTLAALFKKPKARKRNSKTEFSSFHDANTSRLSNT